MILTENIKSLIGNHVAPYIYNSKEFKAGTTPIYYSGPYWDNKEIEAAVNTFLNGKWITAGEEVWKFERKFGKKFNSKFNQMVNSGSSANLVMITALKKYFGWEDDDEIIVSPVGFATTISVLSSNSDNMYFSWFMDLGISSTGFLTFALLGIAWLKSIVLDSFI